MHDFVEFLTSIRSLVKWVTPLGVTHYNDTYLEFCILRFLVNINNLQYQNTLKTMPKKIMDFEHPTLQGVTNERALTQGVASLALG